MNGLFLISGTDREKSRFGKNLWIFEQKPWKDSSLSWTVFLNHIESEEKWVIDNWR